jgi:predicted dehydrogenase
MKQQETNEGSTLSRRDLIRGAAAAGLGLAALGQLRPGYAQGSDMLKVGVIGFGGRGTGAALDILAADPGVEIVAASDIFADRLEAGLKKVMDSPHKDRIKIPADRQFTGWDNHEKLLATDIDIVILATTPHFRPMMIEAAVKAGKHVFMEKPVAVDPVGVRRVIAAGKEAQKKKLTMVAGTQRRHSPDYIENIRLIHDGAIGELVGGQCYWNMGELWHRGDDPAWTPMERQMRNWYYYTWLCGDHIVEQHLHQLDVMNWAFGGPPVSCMGMGGRQTRTDPKFGNIFDHFAVEYVYANGARVMSMCRQAKGCAERVNQRVVGTLGDSTCEGKITGKNAWTFEGTVENPQVQEHRDMLASIRGGAGLNDCQQVAESTLTVIMGRMSAYTGREINWNWVLNKSELDLTPEAYAFGPAPEHPVAIPGQTELI